MNKKLTKLLSVFIIAGAIGTGSAFGLAGCGHKHSAASEWQSDETNHWHDCTDNDGEKLDVGAHEYDNEQDATCNVCGHERQVTIAVTGVSLDQTEVTLKMGETVTATLVATVSPSNASNKQVSWSSSDETVATVANGVVTALKEGTATITVTTADGSRTATCAVTVQAADVTPEPETPTITGVTASASKTAATVNDTITLTATVSGTGEYNQNVTWAITEGSDKATLEGNTLTVTGAGIVKVQATAVGDTTKKSEEITITVTAATVTPDPTPETYTVTWKNGDETLETDTNVAKDATPSYDGTTPTKAATAQYTYTFNGWTDGTNTYGLTDELPAVKGDVTYTAVFAETVNKYTVTWKNGEETLATAQVEYGTVPTFTGAEPTKAATAQYTYTFAGWNEEVVAVTGEATYTAKFTETVNKYTVTWKNYDGTVLETDAEVPYGTVPTYDRENPTKVEDGKNFAFSGWDKEVVAVTGNVEYTAQFTELQSGQYSVTFNMNGHGAAIADGVTTDGKITAPTAPTADGYTFGGWFETAACDGTAIDFATKEFTANTTVYAKWTIIEYTVTFKNGEETVGDVQKYTIENKEITVPTVPAKTGYNGAWTAYDLDVLENKTVQAVYTAIEYTITYNLDGGTNAQDPATTYTIESEDITLAAPTKDGYRFDGWYNADNEKVVTIAKGSTGDITLTAKWVEQVTLTVTDKSGATVGSSAFDKGATVTLEELDELTTAPAGYAVWKVYTDFNAGTEYTAGEITADTTLVATFVLTEEGYKAALNATIALKNVTVKMGEGTPNTVFAADGTKVLNAFDAVYRVYSADGYDEYVNVNGEWYKRTVASTVDGYQDYDAYVYEVMSEYILLGEFINMYSQGTYDDKNDEYVISIQNGAELGAEFKLTISDGKVTTMAASTQTGTQVVSITEVSDTITLPEAKEYTKFLELSTQPNNVISEDFSDYEENYRLTDTANKYGIYADKASEIENFSVTNGKLTQTTNGANFGLTIPFGITNGDVEGYFEVSVNDTGSKWKLLQFSTVSSPALIIGTSDSDKTKLSYSVNGGTYTATNIAFSANTLYKVHFVYTSGGVLSVDINGVEIVSNVDIGTGVDRVYLVSGSSGARKLTLDNIAVCANQITAGEYYETAIAALNAKYSAEYILADTVDGEGNPVKATHSINAERVTSIYDMYTNATDGVLLVYAPEGECADYSVQELICRIDEMFVQLQEIDTDEAVLAAREVAKQAVQNYYNEIKSNYTEREAELSSRLDIEFEVINNMTSVNDIERYTNGETRSIYDEETGVWIENVYYTAEQVLAEIFEGVENDTTVWTGELETAKTNAEAALSADVENLGLNTIDGYTDLMAKKNNGATTAESAAIANIEGIIATAKTDIVAVEVGADGAATVESIVAKAYSDIAAEIAKSSENIETVKTTAKTTLADYAQAEIDKLDAETDATLIKDINAEVDAGNDAIDAIVVDAEGTYKTFEEAQTAVTAAVDAAKAEIEALVAADTLAKTKASATEELNALKVSTHNTACNTEIATLVEACITSIGTAKTVEQVDTLKQECVTAVEERIATLKTTQFTVTFANCEGVAEQQVTYDNLATAPETNPTKADSLFRGWYADEECTTEFDFANVNIYDNTTVYAKWLAADVTITLNVNGEVYKTIKTFSGNEPDAPAIALPTEVYVANKNFAYWYESDINTEYSLPESFVKDATVTLNAKLVDKYETNADITESESWIVGAEDTAFKTDAKLFSISSEDGYNNPTWNEKTKPLPTIKLMNGTNYQTTNAIRHTNGYTNSSSSIEIVAKESVIIRVYVAFGDSAWAGNRTGTISYSGGTSTINSEVSPIAVSADVSNTTAHVIEVKLVAGEKLVITGTETAGKGSRLWLFGVEAQLSEDYTNMTVSYHKYNGTDTLGTTEDIAWSSLKTLKGTEETDSNANGDKFMGWATSESASVALTEEELAALEYKPGATINLYPVFKTADITVTYMIDYDGLGNGIPFVEYQKVGLIFADGESSAVATKPEDPALEDETKTYRFESTWYWDEACTDECKFNEPLSANTVLYAKYVAIEWVTVTWVTSTDPDVSSIVNKAFENGNTLTKPETDPTPAEGYRFLGWVMGEDTSVDVYDFSKPITLDGALVVTFTAKYEKIPYVTLTLMNGETKLDEIAKAGINGETITAEITDPTPEEGYLFDGWYTQDGSTSGEWGDKVDFKKYTLNVTLDPETGLGALTLYAKIVDKNAKLNEDLLLNSANSSKLILDSTNSNRTFNGDPFYNGTSFSIAIDNAAIIDTDKTPAKSDDGKTFSECLLPSGGTKTYTVTAKKSVTLKLYVTLTDGSWSGKTGDVTLNGSAVDGLSFASNTNTGTAYLLEFSLAAGETATISSTNKTRLALYAVYAVYTAG